MKRRIRYCIGLTTVLLIVIYCVFLLVFGVCPTRLVVAGISRKRLQAEMPLAESRWEQHQVNYYEITVTFVNTSPIWFQCTSGIEPTTFQVRDGVVVEATNYDLSVCGEVYQDLTIEAMFDRVAADIASYDLLESKLYVRFDPEWGYVAEYRIEDNQPIWVSIGDQFTQVKVQEVKPLP